MCKYYVIADGKNKGIYTDSDQYVELCRGQPNNNSRGFGNLDDAAEHIKKHALMPEKFYVISDGKSSGIYFNKETFEKYKPKKISAFVITESFSEAVAMLIGEYAGAIAYIDGSANPGSLHSKYGGVLLYNGLRYDFQGFINESPGELSPANIAELSACCTAISLAKELNAKKINVFYDFVGVEEWAKYRSEKSSIKQKYYDFISCAGIDIIFAHIKSHSGDAGNNAADKLAKNALAAPYNPFAGTGSLYIRTTVIEEFDAITNKEFNYQQELSFLKEQIKVLSEGQKKIVEMMDYSQ